MISTQVADAPAIEDAIADALANLRGRMSGLGDGFEIMTSAMERALVGGKRIRPALVLRSYRALNGDAHPPPPVLQVAAAFELLHTAFVMHDDVIDHDTIRRGVPNVIGEFRARAEMRGARTAAAADVGDAAGILAGDLLLHEAHRLIARVPVAEATRARLLDLIDDAVVVSAAGELADVEHAALPDAPDLDDTLATTRNKTAVYSFSAPLRAGAALAGASVDIDAALARSGTHLGIAFQLVDDLIGAFGDAALAGRAEGADLVAAKRTPLVALARETSRWPYVHHALALAHTGPVALRTAQRELADSGAATRIQALTRRELDQALSAAEPLPAPLREVVTELTDLVEGRMP